MASEKISAMPSLGGNQVPTDLVPLVDLSALPASQNVKSTLNDLFAILTKNITDRAVRFSAPGSTPALSAAGAGALYFDGTKFQVSENTGAWASLVVAGLITGSGLTQNTARLLGRTTAGVGAVEEISVGANLALSAGSLAVTGVALSGLVTASGLTQNTARLLGRTTAGVGAVEEISIGPGLTLTGGVLDATGGGGGTPGGSQYDVQFHDSGGTFGGSNNFQFKPSGNPTVSIRATSASHNVLDLTADVAQTAEVLLIKQDGDNTASLLTLRQGPLSTLNSSFPFRFENAAGTLILGLRSRPATGIYQFVSPGATNGQVVYEVNSLGSNNGLGTASVSGYPAIFAGNIQCVWFNGSTGNTVLNNGYQLTWGNGPTTNNVGFAASSGGVLRLSNGASGPGQLQIGKAGELVYSSPLSVFSYTNVANTLVIYSTNSAKNTVTPISGFGGTVDYYADASATTDETIGRFTFSWTNPTSANLSSQFFITLRRNNALHVPLAITATGVGINTSTPAAQFEIASNAGGAGGGLLLRMIAENPTISASYLAMDYRVPVTGLVGQMLVSANNYVTGSNLPPNSFAFGTYAAGSAIVFAAADTLRFNVGGFAVSQEVAKMNTTGLGLKVATPAYLLQLGADSAAKPLTNTWTIVSDRRVKTNIQDYTRGLAEILNVRPVTYTYNGDFGFTAGLVGIGIIAQEIAQVLPETVTEQPNGLFTYEGHAMTFVLINAIKELNRKIEQLEMTK